MKRVSAAILGILIFLASTSFAQTITGSITGRVVDQQGAVVPNATVRANDSARNTNISTRTSDSGDFSIAGLFPGNYTITVEAAGFKKLERKDTAER